MMTATTGLNDEWRQMLKQVRLERGFSKGEAARRAGVTRNMVTGIEDGTYNPTIETLDRYARGLGVRIEIQVWRRT